MDLLKDQSGRELVLETQAHWDGLAFYLQFPEFCADLASPVEYPQRHPSGSLDIGTYFRIDLFIHPRYGDEPVRRGSLQISSQGINIYSEGGPVASADGHIGAYPGQNLGQRQE